MRALTHFSLLAIAIFVAARPRAIERRYAVSRPGEEAPSFAAAVSGPQDTAKRHLEAQPKEVGPSFSPADSIPWVLNTRAPEAEPKNVVTAFSVAGTAPRDIGKRLPEAEPKTVVTAFSVAGTGPRVIEKRLPEAKPKEVEPSFTAADPASQDIRRRFPEAEPKTIEPSFTAIDSASQDIWERSPEAEPKAIEPSFAAAGWAPNAIVRRSAKTEPKEVEPSFAAVESPQRLAPRYSKDRKEKFAVNGTAIPDVDFDVGESYAGLLPISQKLNETGQLYFWYFPSQNPLAQDEITIWLNGGPGCSSFEGLLQENGPFLWQSGTFKPVQNPYSWVNLTNMVWIEQPVGTGFSQGKPTAKNVEDSSAQFLGFFRNFVDTFDLHHKKIYIAGESFAGKYIPYIANAMLNTNDTEYYNVEGILLYDPSLNSDAIQEQVPAVAYTDYFAPLFPFNRTFKEDIHKRADSCGYTSFLNENLVFPPKGLLPNAPNDTAPGCDLWYDIFIAIFTINPCFNVYQITTTCPLLWDVLGFPGSFEYTPRGATVYFNRTDVQKAINAPIQPWQECSDGVFSNEDSPDSALSVLPGVIEKLNRTIIAHGQLDYILIANGSLLAIQNMTWNGAQGFQQEPKDEFYVPEYNNPDLATLAGSGIFGTTHTERGLTWVEVSLAGHMLPQFAPGAGYRHLEFLLGRIGSLTEQGNFTTVV